MLKKLFKVHKPDLPSHRVPPKLAAGASKSHPESSSALKVVHAGGFVECYYMAVPAGRILEKYPSCILARPEVFRQPWDSVVRPEEVLIPGEKFFLVPCRTVRKLRHRIRRPDYREVSCSSFASKSSIDIPSVDRISCLRKSTCLQSQANDSTAKASSQKKIAVKKHVRFAGIVEKNRKLDNDPRNKSSISPSNRAKTGPLNAAEAWEPALKAICERTDE